MDKRLIHQHLVQILLLKNQSLIALATEFSSEKTNDAKSSAGDKHEVGIAMQQIEQEKITKQANVIREQLSLLAQIDLSKKHFKISLGSLVKCAGKWYYFSVGLGSLEVAQQEVICLSPLAPLGQVLRGKAVSDEVTFQGKRLLIEHIF